ncbi:MAG: tetratricopeptide repeat protein, partial [Candidatus Thorarchaeota archaeon]
ELWYVFLSALANSVGFVASRHSPPKGVDAEESELTELDNESCMELLERRGISDEEVQAKIVSVSGGNPFVLNCICDIPDSHNLSIEDVQNLGAETLEEVRVKTWRRLFSQTEGLLDLIDRMGLVPFIDRRIMSIIAPSMKSAHWDQMKKLSFVQNRGDGTLVLHNLARELILAELGDKIASLTEEVSDSLRQAALKDSDCSLMGIALSAEALAAESDVMTKVHEIVDKLRKENRYMDALSLLESVSVPTDEGKAPLELLRGRVLYGIDRVVDAEQSFRVALDFYRRLSAATPDSIEFVSGIAETLARLGGLLRRLDRPSDSETAFWEAIAVYRQLATKDPVFLKDVAETLCSLAFLLLSRHREKEAEDAVNEAIEIYGQLAATGQDSDIALSGTASTLIISGRLLGLQDRLSEAEEAYRKAIEIYRELSHKDPDGFSKNIGATLHRLAFILLRRHNAVGAETALQEELDIFREFAEKAPKAYQRHMARALGSIGYLFFCTGRPVEAEDALRESLEIFRQLAEKSPRAYMDSVANRLNDLGRLLRELRRYDEAEQSFTEALGLFREFARDAPEVYSMGECASCQLSITLQELGHLFRITDRMFESEDALREAINIAREIERNIPHHRHSFLVSRMLHDYAILLRHTDRLEEAEDTLSESLRIFRELSKRSPDAYLHVLASSLNNQAILLRQTDRLSEAEKASSEALEVYRNLSRESPDLFLRHYASTLNNHGILLKHLGRFDESEAAFLEVQEINRAAAENAELHTSQKWSEEDEDEDLWFHEIFYHWSDCPFCV